MTSRKVEDIHQAILNKLLSESGLECFRIHVLPEGLKTNIDPQAIPKINSTPQQKCIDVLGELLGCKRYKNSLAEFWFLDTLANLLRRAQEDEMDRPTQAILMIWFCEWMKEMQYFDAADRKRMMKRFQENMLAAARFIAQNDRIPTPYDAGISYKSPEDELKDTQSSLKPDSKHFVHFAGSTFECCMLDLLKAREEKLLEEQEERDKEMWALRSSILPLSFAATEEFFNKYWPAPPPAPEPEAAPDTAKSKGKIFDFLHGNVEYFAKQTVMSF
ncbi:hypothetical protein HF086_017216 [Spodoptera exigua]|uniref:Uncharacterized protein n=1 Tax=Spodoptera exigua TaxID=7107 RepID=A0A922MDG0_SPOEX|nr:hypothetical protein HF086_017216 [Spodoptera exigua]